MNIGINLLTMVSGLCHRHTASEIASGAELFGEKLLLN
jgi:hypothetical protein